MTAVEIGPATADDVLSFYGEIPKCSVRAIVAKIDGRIVGIGGLQYHRDSVVAFSKIAPELKARRKDLVRAGRVVMKMIEGRGADILAAADPDEPTAHGYLSHLGFEKAGMMDGHEVYRWRSSHSR